VWNSDKESEYPLMNALLAVFLGLFGSGAATLDNTLGFNYPTAETFVVAGGGCYRRLGGLLLGSGGQTEVHTT
jgi:hypothetical protein